VRPRRASVADVQALLSDDEAMLAWTVADESFVFAIRPVAPDG